MGKQFLSELMGRARRAGRGESLDWIYISCSVAQKHAVSRLRESQVPLAAAHPQPLNPIPSR
jgi:hypothetical protein